MRGQATCRPEKCACVASQAPPQEEMQVHEIKAQTVLARVSGLGVEEDNGVGSSGSRLTVREKEGKTTCPSFSRT